MRARVCRVRGWAEIGFWLGQLVGEGAAEGEELAVGK